VSQFQNVPFWPISALGSNFNPQNTQCILPVEMFTRLFNPVSLRGTLTKLKRFESGSSVYKIRLFGGQTAGRRGLTSYSELDINDD
jgi:hypothetical protein